MKSLDLNRVQGTATHELCGTADCLVREQFTQATRTEPMQSLGLSAYCPTCQVSFKPAAVQPTRARATIDYLRLCQQARAAGHPVRMTTDPAWLVNQAINRRAGWLESPHGDTSRGTSQAIDGHFPRKCGGNYLRHLEQTAREINTPRRVVHIASLGEHRWLVERIPHRFADELDHRQDERKVA